MELKFIFRIYTISLPNLMLLQDYDCLEPNVP